MKKNKIEITIQMTQEEYDEMKKMTSLVAIGKRINDCYQRGDFTTKFIEENRVRKDNP